MNALPIVVLSGALALTPAAAAQDKPDGPKPWRLSRALQLPDWFSLSGHQRTRYEALDGQFRAGRAGSDQLWAFRTDLTATLRFDPLEFVAEGMDSRQELADSGTPLDNTTVNAVELLQAHAGLHLDDVFDEGDQAFVLAGRHTMDIGSRRLVARNRFRNTINNFTGVNALWQSARGESLRAFWVLPVHRLPADAASLLNNDVRFDEEQEGTQFFGAYATLPELCHGITPELGFFGLLEDDRADQETRDRRLYTATARVFAKPAAGALDFELESALQFGKSRATSSASDTRDLDHLAHFQHTEIGYSFDARWKPHLALQFDYASGDQDPNDGDNNRFDTLFGARRFDFGPTGIFGAFARSNLVSPGYRLQFAPCKGVKVMLAHRFYWLASDRDAWTTAGVRDASGSSGSHIGQMPEIEVRWDAVPGNLEFDVGAAHLFAGSFVDRAPNANGEGDATYVYVQSVLTF